MKITALSDVCDITKFTGPPVYVEGLDGDLGLQTYSDDATLPVGDLKVGVHLYSPLIYSVLDKHPITG